MKNTEYLSLIKNGVIDNYYGTAKHYWDKAPYNHKELDELMCSQLDEIIDYNNIIILHPAGVGIGGFPFLFGNRQYLADHISNLVDTKYILDSKGIKFKNGERLTDNKYRQSFFSMIIVKDGVAYVSTGTSNPFKGITYCRYKGNSDIHITEEDLKNINLNDLNIMFSGFFKYNHEINQK